MDYDGFRQMVLGANIFATVVLPHPNKDMKISPVNERVLFLIIAS